MEKMVFAQIKRDIERLMIEQPFKMVFNDNPEDFQKCTDELLFLEYIDLDNVNQFKYGKKIAFRLMYNNNVFNPIFADTFNISKEDFNEELTRLTHVCDRIRRCEQSWVKNVVERAEEAKIEELAATIDFKNRLIGEGKSFLRDLIHQKNYLKSKNPGTVSFYEEQLAILNGKIVEDGDLMSDLDYKYRHDEISSSEYEEQKKILKGCIKNSVWDKSRIFGKINYDRDSVSRMLLIKAIPKKSKIFKEGEQHLTITSINNGYNLLNDYCRWFNDSHSDQIRISKAASKKESDKIYYNKGKDPAIEQRKNDKKKQQKDLIRLVEEEKMSISKAAKELGIAKNTASRWLKK